MSNKHCNTCDTTKPASEFGLRAASADGLSARCKDCQREYDKLRAMAPHRVQARAAYLQTDAGRQARKRATLRYSRENPAKRAAHIAVGNAIRDGKLHKGPCEVCGNPKAEAHHDDYDRPLKVRWLCDTHHKARHRELAAKGKTP